MPLREISNRRFDPRPHTNPNRRPERPPTSDGAEGDRHRNQMRLEQACADFEALLIQKLFQTMRASIPKSGFIDAGSAEAIYSAMLDQKVAQDLALQGGLGLSSQIKEQIVTWLDKLKV